MPTGPAYRNFGVQPENHSCRYLRRSSAARLLPCLPRMLKARPARLVALEALDHIAGLPRILKVRPARLVALEAPDHIAGSSGASSAHRKVRLRGLARRKRPPSVAARHLPRYRGSPLVRASAADPVAAARLALLRVAEGQHPSRARPSPVPRQLWISGSARPGDGSDAHRLTATDWTARGRRLPPWERRASREH